MFHFNLFSSIWCLVLHIYHYISTESCAVFIVSPYFWNYVHFTHKLAFILFYIYFSLYLSRFFRKQLFCVAFVLFIVLIGVSIVTLIILLLLCVYLTRILGIEHGDCGDDGVEYGPVAVAGGEEEEDEKHNRNIVSHVSTLNACIVSESLCIARDTDSIYIPQTLRIRNNQREATSIIK